MSDQNLDPRVTPMRGDLAAKFLKGKVTAERYADGEKYQFVHGVCNLYSRPDETSVLASQILYGERFTVYEIKDGWAWGQAAVDGYVGYCRVDCLSPDLLPTTHHVTNLCSHIYTDADPKSRIVGAVYMMSEVSVSDPTPVNGFVRLADGHWIFGPHISDRPVNDPVSEALKFLYVPYLWGGRSSAGIDCSGLVQLAFAAAGIAVPRDSDQQRAVIGDVLEDNAVLQKGDIAFFPGHVGFMLDDMHLLHANAHHMRVSIDPLREVIDVVSFQTEEPPLTCIKRL